MQVIKSIVFSSFVFLYILRPFLQTATSLRAGVGTQDYFDVVPQSNTFTPTLNCQEKINESRSRLTPPVKGLGHCYLCPPIVLFFSATLGFSRFYPSPGHTSLFAKEKSSFSFYSLLTRFQVRSQPFL